MDRRNVFTQAMDAVRYLRDAPPRAVVEAPPPPPPSEFLTRTLEVLSWRSLSHLPLLASSNELPLASCVKPALGLDECYVEPHWTLADRKEHLALLLEFLADREPSAVFYRAPAPAPGPSPAPAPAPSPSIFEAEAPPFYRGLRPRTPEAFAPPYQRGSGRKRLRHFERRAGTRTRRRRRAGPMLRTRRARRRRAAGRPILRKTRHGSRPPTTGPSRPSTFSMMSISVRTSRRVSASFPPTTACRRTLSRRLPRT